jgi:hypothetical protein
MTAEALTFVPAPRTTPDAAPEPGAPRPVEPPREVTSIAPDDAVMLPRHIADAAYHVLQAMHALKDNGADDLFAALGKALRKGSHRPQVEHPPPCEVCQVDVSYGLPHHYECYSEDATAHRGMVIPQIEPEF